MDSKGIASVEHQVIPNFVVAIERRKSYKLCLLNASVNGAELTSP